MQQNVDFLVNQNYISSADASAIVARLPAVDGSRSTAGAPRSISMPQPERRAVPQPPAPRRATPVVQARALWAYNEDGQVRTHSRISVSETSHTRSIHRNRTSFPSQQATSSRSSRRPTTTGGWARSTGNKPSSLRTTSRKYRTRHRRTKSPVCMPVDRTGPMHTPLLRHLHPTRLACNPPQARKRRKRDSVNTRAR